MNDSLIRRMISMLLIVCLAMGGTAAFALTGEEALGLGSASAGDSAATAGSGYPTLQLGDRDGDDTAAYVVMLQNRLISLGYLATNADGQYGAQTEQAIVAFQQGNGLTTTGVADSLTQSVLFSDEAQRATAKQVEDNSTLRLQQKLSEWGFLTWTPDGVLGEGTMTAVANFKEYLYKDCAQIYGANATPVPSATPEATADPNAQPMAVDMPIDTKETEGTVSESGFDGTVTEDIMKYVDGEYEFQIYQKLLQKGDEGAEVWRVQNRLEQLNYLYKPDGAYGVLTQYALMYFQKLNGLKETGIADQETQGKLFSANTVRAEENVFPYKLYIDISDQRVYIFQWDGSGYNKPLKKFKCSTGVDNAPTPTGTYQSGGKVTSGMWYYFKDFNCYAKYAYRIVGGILFHSVLYNSAKKGPTNSSVHALGKKASHGCVRLAEDNAKWIFENCPEGTTVVIQQ